MELGEKLRQARMEAGLSQRQLCGEEITRNMLSLIENGSAKPSMKTLQYLAGRLGKNLSYFLEENAVLSPNQQIMDAARQHFDAGNFPEADRILGDYRAPDPVYDREKEILWVLLRLELAAEAIRQQRFLYAADLLKQTPIAASYLKEELNRKRLLLLGTIPGQKVATQLPSLDAELLIRAGEAFSKKDLTRSAHLLEAMEAQDFPQWYLLRGRICLKQKQWEEACRHLQKAESAFPRDVYPLLETCWRELGDFRMAYEYACKQR
jgi:transcriptional regulator with XRE-family HTH domain